MCPHKFRSLEPLDPPQPRGQAWQKLRARVGQFLKRYGKVGLAVLAVGGVGATSSIVVPPMMWDTACQRCCDVVMWCCDKVEGSHSVIDCSFGPYAAGDGMFPWILAERGCNVRVLDLGHEYATDFNPARIVVPENLLKGEITFQVAASHRLIPTALPRADWFAMILTLQHIPQQIASPILMQSLHSARRVLVVEALLKPTFSSCSLYMYTPPFRRTVYSRVHDLLCLNPEITLEERTEVGPFTCYILSLDEKHRAEPPPPVPVPEIPVHAASALY